MLFLHVVMAVMATSRITQIVTGERIFERIRQRWPIYLWTCQLCVSVWAGIACTVLYVYAPFLLWPFGLSGLFVFINALMAVIESFKKQVGVIIKPGFDGVHVDWNGNDARVAANWVRKVAASLPENK